MIETYSAYIRRFIDPAGLSEATAPGEHHFVAVYLLPKILAIHPAVPDYVNPDGTKQIIGDIVYFKDGKHHFGIEVKLGTIRLTAGEFNNWILGEDLTKHPNVFVAIGSDGIVLQSWSRFRETYREIATAEGRFPEEMLKPPQYGPRLDVDKLARHIKKKEGWRLGGAVSSRAIG